MTASVLSPGARITIWDRASYWCGIPVRLGGQFFRNCHDIARVVDLLKFHPLAAGAVPLDHPWVTGISPHTGKWIWPDNIVYRSPRSSGQELPTDEEVVIATGKFMASRVKKSAVVPELPVGPKRRMPHAINYMHGSSHYNSGLILLNDLGDGFAHLSDPQFRRDLRAFVRSERREVLFLFRDRDYDPRQFAYLSCCMRMMFPWFCNPNGPQRRVLWGNLAPFAAANLITGHWASDVYALAKADGPARVSRPAIPVEAYFTSGPYHGNRDFAIWPEKALAKANDLRIRMRGRKSGMFFVDRRNVYEDQLAGRERRGEEHDFRASI